MPDAARGTLRDCQGTEATARATRPEQDQGVYLSELAVEAGCDPYIHNQENEMKYVAFPVLSLAMVNPDHAPFSLDYCPQEGRHLGAHKYPRRCYINHSQLDEIEHYVVAEFSYRPLRAKYLGCVNDGEYSWEHSWVVFGVDSAEQAEEVVTAHHCQPASSYLVFHQRPYAIGYDPDKRVALVGQRGGYSA